MMDDGRTRACIHDKSRKIYFTVSKAKAQSYPT